MPGKHSPNRLENYIDIYETIIEQQLRGGFLLRNNLVFIALHDQILIEGSLNCRGDIYIDVRKRLTILSGEGSQALVQTTSYSYNVALVGVGNIFRYDSPHSDHNKFHHLHKYDVLNGDKQGEVHAVDSEKWRHLQEVIEEAMDWHYDNYSRSGIQNN